VNAGTAAGVTSAVTPELLTVSDLRVTLLGPGHHPIEPVRGVTLRLARGQRLGIVGESGSGKSLTALALMRLLHPPARLSGEVLLDGEDLLQLSDRAMARVRAKRMSMIYQDPMSSLNPVFTVGKQIVEAIRIAGDVSTGAARARAIDLLGEVGVPEPKRRIDSYPHEFSGGMRQRVMIAMALSTDPDVIIADEPTTALDVTTQARVIDLLSRVVRDRGLAVILITHDLGVAAGFCDEVKVMYAGRFVESAPVDALYAQAVHPYTEALLNAVCRLDADIDRPMIAIGGQPPLPGALPAGCPFHPRCPAAETRCSHDVPVPVALGEAADERFAECHFAVERSLERARTRDAATSGDPA
jgi:peptide/nickel transport system ATP-binding protein